MADDGGRRPYPTWLRVTLIALQALGVVAGLVLGFLTYDAWSHPDDADSAPTTTEVPPETAVPPDTLG